MDAMAQAALRNTFSAPPYYDEGMTSVRLDPDLEARLELAAQARGESKSTFIREAITMRIEETLKDNMADRLAHVIGKIDLGGGLAELSKERVGELMEEEARAKEERARRR